MFGVYPDDCELESSRLVALIARVGGVVRFVFVIDGSNGCHEMTGPELVECRRTETRIGAAAVGVTVTNLGSIDGWLFSDRALHEAMITAIRSFRPHVVVSPRPPDYHLDHQAITTAV